MQYSEKLIICKFIDSVQKADIEEFVEPFCDAKIVAIVEGADVAPTWACISVPVGQEEEFVEYAECDVIVNSAERAVTDDFRIGLLPCHKCGSINNIQIIDDTSICEGCMV